MKQFFLLALAALLLAGPAHVRAQTPDPVQQQRDLIFAHLDKSQVPTGRLAEAGVRLLDLRTGV